jgi:PAS domain S-box-containing protein
MGWLAFGVLYSAAYAASGALLSTHPLLVWFRSLALLAPPLLGVVAIVRRRHLWTGCQWLFWATIALGLGMSALGVLGWMTNDLLFDRQTSWLGWHGVFALFGAAAPLFALLAQPHRGSREAVAATTAVDIAGIALLTGFLYSHFVIAPDLVPAAAEKSSMPLLILSELQQFLVLAGMVATVIVGRATPWAATYRRLALGMFVSFITLTLSNIDIWEGAYRPAFVYDFIWILPFAFYPWAAEAAPGSAVTASHHDDRLSTPPRPWLIFGVLGIIPFIDYGLRQVVPLGPLEGFRDLSTAVTIVSALPLLMARLAVERSERRETDSRVRLLAAATEQADELIFILQENGQFQYANAAFCRHLGYSLEELNSLAFPDVLAEESAAQAAAILEAVRTGTSWRGTLVRRRKDGSTFPASSTIVPLSDLPVGLAHYVGVERNVTEEVQTREQLIHTERLSAVGQLVSGVAHELNNPLQSIMAFSDLLIQDERRQQTRRDLEQIRAEAQRAGKIVRNLLTFVRRSASERAVVDFNEVVRRTVALRRYELAMANIALEARYANKLPAVVVNREEIQQVILNLILNAEQAMRNTGKGGRLVIRTDGRDACVVCHIEDDGPGVPPALAGRIFEPFFSTKGVGKGTGLGLSIALGIAEAHGGALALVPSATGTCFRLTLPVSQDLAGARAEPVNEIKPFRTSGLRRALVVDDEPAVRRSLRRLLLNRRFSVDLAKDGETAADLLNENPYDVVLCDVRMPKMGGIALYSHVNSCHPEVLPGFAFLSGDILNTELQLFVEQSQIPLLAKPFTAEQLDSFLEGLRRRFHRERSARGARHRSRRVTARAGYDRPRHPRGLTRRSPDRQ